MEPEGQGAVSEAHRAKWSGLSSKRSNPSQRIVGHFLDENPGPRRLSVQQFLSAIGARRRDQRRELRGEQRREACISASELGGEEHGEEKKGGHVDEQIA